MDALPQRHEPVAAPAVASPAGGLGPTVLIAAGRREQGSEVIWETLLRAARQVVSPTSPDCAAAADGQTSLTATGDATHAVTDPTGAAACMSALIDEGYEQLVVVPVPPDENGDGQAWQAALARAIAAARASHPRARIHDLGGPIDPGMARAFASFVAAPQAAPDSLLAGAVVRGFDGDPATLSRFLVVLREALPPGTTLALRGSAVVGHSFRTGAPFDAAGPRSSDLDVVAIGEPAVELWVPEARLMGGINTLPLSDKAGWVAPVLDGPRGAAQEIVRRPLSLQAMAGWFLELRTILQGQPYVVLSDPL